MTVVCLSNSITTEDIRLELLLCEILKHTPNYMIYELNNNANCVAQVKTFGNLLCLRNTDNQVNCLKKSLPKSKQKTIEIFANFKSQALRIIQNFDFLNVLWGGLGSPGWCKCNRHCDNSKMGFFTFIKNSQMLI